MNTFPISTTVKCRAFFSGEARKLIPRPIACKKLLTDQIGCRLCILQTVWSSDSIVCRMNGLHDVWFTDCMVCRWYGLQIVWPANCMVCRLHDL